MKDQKEVLPLSVVETRQFGLLITVVSQVALK